MERTLKKNVLILCGGGGAEHEVSMVTANYIESQIDRNTYNSITVEIKKDLTWSLGGKPVNLTWDKKIVGEGFSEAVDCVIPWLHGYPGETGHVTAFLDLIGLPYLGCKTESHMICFNKVLTKLWCEKVGVPCTEFDVITSMDQVDKALAFFDKYGSAFIKASNQGSSVGCYPVKQRKDLSQALADAFQYSDFVVIERLVNVRELEISVFDFQGNTHATKPCEILCPDKFYSYEEKYSQTSQTKVELVADIPSEVTESIRALALDAYRGLKLRHGVRMDFFLEGHDKVLLNEINTYPGMTPISMFPKMMANYGVEFPTFLSYHLEQLTSSH